MDALVSLQTALDTETVYMQRCKTNSYLKVLLDHPNGEPRFTYARIVKGIVQSTVIFVPAEHVDGIPCLAIGYAVIESKRGRGLATKTVEKAMEDMLRGLQRNGIPKFYVEAIVATSNTASN